jgi:hypothetical protein
MKIVSYHILSTGKFYSTKLHLFEKSISIEGFAVSNNFISRALWFIVFITSESKPRKFGVISWWGNFPSRNQLQAPPCTPLDATRILLCQERDGRIWVYDLRYAIDGVLAKLFKTFSSRARFQNVSLLMKSRQLFAQADV